jgi:hypothetical protein
MEYQPAGRMPALQRFTLDLEEGMKLAPIFHQMQNILFYVLRRKSLVHYVLGCNISPLNAILMMGQDSLGQLYDV